MATPQATHIRGRPRSGVLVVGCWTTGRLPLFRVTAWVDSAPSPARPASSRSQAHAALDAWLDRLGVD